jgi:hypothetical protein
MTKKELRDVADIEQLVAELRPLALFRVLRCSLS